MVGVVVVLIGGLLADAYLYHRNTGGGHPVANIGPTSIPELASPSPSPVVLPSPSPIPVPATSMVADAAVSTVPVYGSPAVGKVLADFPNINGMGQPESFLVVGTAPGWYLVEVPVKPNGAEAWVQASDVTIRSDPYYIRVYQSQFRLEVYVGGALQKSFEVATGAPSTPTPYGRFYIWASESYGAPYTPGIFALSGFSPVLDNWPGGGRAGIHGWTDTSIIGRRASHGCVRMRPTDFSQLLHTVPLGTPVDILT
ncbi:MAG TPA: L,D-transpeptidase [Actinomycetota bacterium]|nr:L,D-transpeptidase [Actinomycetota bacterium]